VKKRRYLLWVIVGALALLLLGIPVGQALTTFFTAGGGDLTPYLIGDWDCRTGRTTIFHVKNPTHTNWLLVWFNFYDDAEHPTACRIALLSPNDVVEVDARFTPAHIGRWGIVKIVSVWVPWRLENGIKGFQKEIWAYRISIPAVGTRPVHVGPKYKDMPVWCFRAISEANLEEVPVYGQALLTDILDLDAFLTMAFETDDGKLYDVEKDEMDKYGKIKEVLDTAGITMSTSHQIEAASE